MAKGFRIGYPEETVAWKALDFEYTELQNEHILEDVAIFLGMTKKSPMVYGGGKTQLFDVAAADWPTTLAAFRRRYGDARGIWICKTRADALLWYGKYYGEGAAILEYEYDPRNVVVELGPDGTFVLEPKFIKEGWADPLYPLKKDLARIFRRPRR